MTLKTTEKNNLILCLNPEKRVGRLFVTNFEKSMLKNLKNILLITRSLSSSFKMRGLFLQSRKKDIFNF